MTPRSPVPSSSSKNMLSKIMMILMLAAAVLASGNDRSRGAGAPKAGGPLPPKGARPQSGRRGDSGGTTTRDVVHRDLEYDQTCVDSCLIDLKDCADACAACYCGCDKCEPAYYDCEDGCKIQPTPPPTYRPTMAPGDDGGTSNTPTAVNDDVATADDDDSASDDAASSASASTVSSSGAASETTVAASGLVGIGLAGTLLAFA
jgi:hypothetical protein